MPTEAEWEYACRAGSAKPSYFEDRGDEAAEERRHLENSRELLRAVEELPPNDFGVYDMLGTVCEWCLDTFGSYVANLVPKTDDGLRYPPIGISNRVVRGGRFLHGAAPWSWRNNCSPDGRYDYISFRPAARDS